MKYEITKEQLQELAKGNAKVERWFPEAFETKFEVGKWYKNKDDNHLYCVVAQTDSQYNPFQAYGFNSDGSWSKTNSRCLTNFRPATESEVFEALKKEAVKRGFVKGAKITNVINEYTENIYSGTYKNGSNSILVDTCDYGNFTIFKDGKWAEIIKEKTLSKSEAEAKLNELINDGYAYKIS